MRKITVIDETLREGMQYRGLVFSGNEREKILDFQEKLGIDICQAGYPPAHESEIAHVQNLHKKSISSGYQIRIAGLCRALYKDLSSMIRAGISDIHMHLNLNEERVIEHGVEESLLFLKDIVEQVKRECSNPVFHVSLLDIGRVDQDLLKRCCLYLSGDLKINLISLPDTSGMLFPDSVCERFQEISSVINLSESQLSTHCHNDMGMASANTLMGVLGGAACVEVSALGIGERNGIGDLYTVCRFLKHKGYDLSVNTEDVDTFKEYYHYIDAVHYKQTGEHILAYHTPFWGQGVITHVAGTHASVNYGIKDRSDYTLNVLCGKHLVKKYLIREGIQLDSEGLANVTHGIKNRSALLNRSLKLNEVLEIVKKQGCI